MKETLLYKGYLGSVTMSIEDDCLHGEILFIDDKVTYEGESPKDLEAQFHEAVDSYVNLCEELGEEPQKPFKGSFNVRIDPELHYKAKKQAYVSDLSLNQFVAEAIQDKIASSKNGPFLHLHEHTHNHVIQGSSTVVEYKITDDLSDEKEWTTCLPRSH